MYLRASFHRSGVNSLRVRSALVLHKQIHIAATRLGWTAVILNSSARLVGHFQTVGHLKKCTVKMVYINLLKVKRRVRSNRLNPPRLHAWHTAYFCTMYAAHATDWRCGQVDIVGGVTRGHQSLKIKS